MRWRAVGRILFVAVVAIPVLLLFLHPLIEFAFGPEQPLGDFSDSPIGLARATESPVEIPESYALAKRLLYRQVFAGHRSTLYCGCPFDARRRPDLAACGYASHGDARRAARVEVEHVVPASWIGQTRRCWREPLCRDGHGRAFKGRKCCEQIDPDYRQASNDLNNLWPSIGEVNEQRSNYRYGLVPGEARAFGRCDFEVDRAGRRVEPRPAIRGDVARISLYMERAHGVRLSPAQRRLFEAWARADPPDAFERERNARITRIQGQGNPLVDGERAPAAALVN